MRRRMTPAEKKKIFRERSFKIYIKITGVFLGMILIFTVLNFFTKDKDYSETENRILAGKPELTLSSLTSGKYMTDMESYITDQFVFRDQWISLKMFTDTLMGRKESNGVYIGKQGTLLEIQETPDMVSVDKNLEAIKAFSERNSDINTVMTLVPNAAYICDQLRPTNAPVRDQSEDINHAKEIVGSSLNFVDLTETMSAHKEEQIYYKTDHHWTSLGAKYAFDTLAPALGIDNPAKDYTVYPVTHSFSGTLASKSGYNKSEDTIEIYVPNTSNMNYMVDYVDEGNKSSSIYVSEALEQKDKYEVFFGGNHTRVDISTPLAENKNLLILKDSYANCFIQFLIPYYRTITVIDARYYYDDIDKLIQDNNITDILILYNVNTFMSDNSLADVLTPDDADTGVSVQDGDIADTDGNAAGDGETSGTAESGETSDTGDGASGEDDNTADSDSVL